MLNVTFLDDGTGTEKVGNYIVRVSVNGRLVHQSSLRGHPRAEGWRRLLWVFAAREMDEEGEVGDGHLGRD